MPEGGGYKYFLKNNLNKADLIRRFNEFVKWEVPRLHLDYPLVITLEKEACKMLWTGVHNWFSCNHEEADAYIMYHYTLEYKPTIVVASDTDILILMVHLFASHLPDHDWFLQTKKNQFVNVSKIYITLVMQLQSRCQQFSSSPAVIQWVISNASPRRLYLNRSWSKNS